MHCQWMQPVHWWNFHPALAVMLYKSVKRTPVINLACQRESLGEKQTAGERGDPVLGQVGVGAQYMAWQKEEEENSRGEEGGGIQ